MRLHLALALISIAPIASADPLIDIPTARKLPYETFKVEFSGEFSDTQTQLLWLDAGIGKSFEATVESQRFGNQAVKPSFDLMYSVISPIPDISPGIAFGMQDIFNTSQDGRRPYLVVTFREMTDTLDGQVPFDLTFGTYIRARLSPFTGISLPVSHRVKVLAEYDGFRPAGGFEFDSSRNLAFRLVYRGADTLADVMWTSRF